jgi:hypothetical protein
MRTRSKEENKTTKINKWGREEVGTWGVPAKYLAVRYGIVWASMSELGNRSQFCIPTQKVIYEQNYCRTYRCI